MKLKNNLFRLILLLGLLLALTACGAEADAEPTPTEIDPVAIFTSAASTVAAQLTETALAFSPTPAPPTSTPTLLPTATLLNTPLGGIPTLTLQPGAPTLVPPLTPVTVGGTPTGPICDAMTFGSDITIPDNSTMEAGVNFEKVWRVYNTGVCTWDTGYVLVPIGSNSTRPGDTNPLDTPNPAWKLNTLVEPGGVIDIGVKLTAPVQAGEYETHYKLMNDRGVYFGSILSVYINVK